MQTKSLALQSCRKREGSDTSLLVGAREVELTVLHALLPRTAFSLLDPQYSFLSLLPDICISPPRSQVDQKPGIHSPQTESLPRVSSLAPPLRSRSLLYPAHSMVY